MQTWINSNRETNNEIDYIESQLTIQTDKLNIQVVIVLNSFNTEQSSSSEKENND